MSSDTLTLKLNGDVPLETYAQAIESLAKLVASLTEEIAGQDEIAWEIADLRIAD